MAFCNSGKILADYECCICGKRKTASSGSGYEHLQKCETENGARNLIQAGFSLPTAITTRLHAEVAGVDWKTVIAKEVFHHRSCYYRDFTRKAYTNKPDENDDVFEELSNFVEEKIVKDCYVVSMADLFQTYSEIKSRKFGKQGTTLKVQSLKDKLKRSFGSKIGFLRPRHGSDLIFNNTVEKGQLVEVAMRAKIASYSDKTIEEKATEVAGQVHHELLQTQDTYSR